MGYVSLEKRGRAPLLDSQVGTNCQSRLESSCMPFSHWRFCLNGLTNCQESALARIWMAQDSLPGDFTEWGITADLIVLRYCSMIDMQSDMSLTLAFVQRLLPKGREHYQEVRRERRRFLGLRDHADELIGLLAADCDRQGCDDPPKKLRRSFERLSGSKQEWLDLSFLGK